MSKGPASPSPISNRKARFRFDIIEQVEAGIALTGSEVKSLRSGKASLEEAFAMVREGEVWLRDCNISPYENAGYAQHKPTRERRLLLHKREIRKLHAKATEQGLTLIPLEMRFNEQGRVKVMLAVCRGKKLHDKRSDLKKREHQRDMDRALRRRR